MPDAVTLLIFRQGLSLTVELTDAASLTDQQAPGIPMPPRVLKLCATISTVLHRFWQSELRFKCSCHKHFSN